MMQWFLALAAAVSCAALCALASRRLGARWRLARAWADAVERMAEAVRQGNPTGEVLRRGAGKEVPLLGQAADALDARPAQAPGEWLAGLAWDALLLPEEKDALAACLSGLLTPDRDGQLCALARCSDRWAEVVRRCRGEWDQNGGLYRHLGWLSGAALFILMC